MKNKCKKILKYVFAALVIAFFVLGAFNTINVTPSSNQYSVSIIDLMFGTQIEFGEENILALKFIPSLLVSGLLLVIAAGALFSNFGKYEKYRGLAILFITTFALITICGVKRNLAALPGVKEDYSYFSFAKVYYAILSVSIALVLVSLVNLWVDEVYTIENKILLYVVIGLMLIVVLSFFIKTVIADYRDENYVFSFKEIIFGTKWEEAKFSITQTRKDLLSLIHYVLMLIAFVVIIIDGVVANFESKRIFGYIGLLTTLIIAIYLCNLLTNSLTITYLNSQEAVTSLNVRFAFSFYGKLVVTSICVSFVLLLLTFIKEKNIKEILEFSIPLLLVVVFCSIYCQSFSVMIKSGTVQYSIGYQKGYDALIGTKLSDHKTNGIYMILYYAFSLAGLICSLVNIKNKKIKYLIVFGLLLIAIIFGLLIPFNLYDVVKEHETYFVKLAPIAWIGFSLLAISCLISFYATFKFEDKKDA